MKNEFGKKGVDGMLINVGTIAITGLAAALAYWWVRSIESRDHAMLYFGVTIWMFVAIVPLPYFEGWYRNRWLLGILIHIILCTLGGWAHRKSGGFSPTLTDGFCLATAATVTGAPICAALTYALAVIAAFWGVVPTDQLIGQGESVWYFGMVFFPPLAPIAYWLLKGNRVRPSHGLPLADYSPLDQPK